MKKILVVGILFILYVISIPIIEWCGRKPPKQVYPERKQDTIKQITMKEYKYKKGSYIVSQRKNDHRSVNDIFHVEQDSNSAVYYISRRFHTQTNGDSGWREATKQEIDWHLLNPKKNLNINDMPKINDTYPIY